MEMTSRLADPSARKAILLVDLNNEAPYPTLAIGCLAAPLVNAGFRVDVFSPLAHGIKPFARDQQESFTDYIAARIQFAGTPLLEWAMEFIYQTYYKLRFRPTKRLISVFNSVLVSGKYDAILVSSYLQYRPMLVSLAQEAKHHQIPLLLGGPFFNQKRVVEQWIDIEGVTAVYGGEADFALPDLVTDLVQGGDLKRRAGVFRREISVLGQAATPLPLTDDLPIPNFDHFHWNRYAHRVIPLMTGRGCGWGHCLFCSDVITASTRTFRSRSLSAVLNELKIQSERYSAKNFIFFDSKLNSDLSMWNGLIKNFQSVVPGGRWVASVHVDGKGTNGLEFDTLTLAYASGLRRISFGLETGSQRLNKLMLKGTDIDRTSRFVMDASRSGISVRTTLILGYPGETAEDVRVTIAFLEKHRAFIDRVKLSKFKAIPGTAFQERIEKKPQKYPSVVGLEWDYVFARGKFLFRPPELAEYRREKARLLKLVHAINSKPLMDEAQQFNGLM
jgi:anaerobic magnesium-protoporphyrin IX monomethyl ester cyclase